MSKILINGDFLCRRMSGIERYAFEITRRLDAMIQHNEAAMLVPANVQTIPAYKNLQLIKHKAQYQSHIVWQMKDVQLFLLRHREFMLLEYANTCLPLAPGIVFLHDIYCECYPDDFTSLREKAAKWYNKYQFRLIMRRAKKIITVSEFSKKQMQEKFFAKTGNGNIAVIPNSWEHFKSIDPDYAVFDDFPALQKKQFFFTLGSLSKRKNLRWIIKYAAQRPDAVFAVSGAAVSLFKVDELEQNAMPKNVLFLGYLTDSRVKALMEQCKAFIFPSYYEGFGVPPLEALSCGAPLIVSNAASLPEIYGGAAHYIDPFNTNVDLDAMLKEPIEAPETALNKYSWDSSAEKVYAIIKEFSK